MDAKLDSLSKTIKDPTLEKSLRKNAFYEKSKLLAHIDTVTFFNSHIQLKKESTEFEYSQTTIKKN